MNKREKLYISNLFAMLPLPTINIHLNLQEWCLSPKTHQLIKVLAKEMSSKAAVIVFMKTHTAVKLLSVLLATHSVTKNIL